MIKQSNNPAQQLLLQFCESYKNRDLLAMLTLFTSDITMWGSGVDECRIGLQQVEEQLERDWSQSEAGEITIINFLPASQQANCAAALCKAKITVDGEDHVLEQLRGTIVIARDAGTWKITHMHASFPDFRNAEGNSFPLSDVLSQ